MGPGAASCWDDLSELVVGRRYLAHPASVGFGPHAVRHAQASLTAASCSQGRGGMLGFVERGSSAMGYGLRHAHFLSAAGAFFRMGFFSSLFFLPLLSYAFVSTRRSLFRGRHSGRGSKIEPIR